MENLELIDKLLSDKKTYPNMGLDLYLQKCEALRTLYKCKDDQSHVLGVKLELRKRINIALNNNELKIQEQKQLLKKYWQTYLFAAPYCFHSYLLYMEKDRDPEKRFYQPRLKVLRNVVRNWQSLADGELMRLGLSMPPGTGKSTLGNFYIIWLMGRDPL